MPCLLADMMNNPAVDCLARLEKDKLVGDSLIIFTVDGKVIHGYFPIINRTSSVLYVRLSDSPTAPDKKVIPYNAIYRITYRKPSNIRYGLTLFGFGVGVAASIWMTKEVYPDADFNDLHLYFYGSLFGGVIGGAIGYKLGGRITSGVTLECR
jgi:hypothetical protein